MCINPSTEYGGGYRSNYNVSCGKEQCKEIAEHQRKISFVCRDCGKAEADRLRRELNDAERRAKDAENALARTPEDSKRAYATLKAEYLKVVKDGKQYAANAERFQKEATDCVTAWALKLEQTKKKIPPNEEIYSEIRTTYGCGHRRTMGWTTSDNFAKEDCYYKSSCEKLRQESCRVCREQEEANRDAAFARLTRAHAAEEQGVEERNARIAEMQGRIDRLAQERDELAERLNIIEGEAVAELREILLDGQRQSEDIDSRLDILVVDRAEFMRQVDEQNAAAEVEILKLEEQLRLMLSQDEKEKPSEGGDDAKS